jgi:hypothetical protein
MPTGKEMEILGSVSVGDLRPRTVVHAYISGLDVLLEACSFLPGADAPRAVRFLGRIEDEVGAIERVVGALIESDPAMLDCIDDIERLMLHVVQFYDVSECYFGAHPDDGADFGWWPTEEDDINV